MSLDSLILLELMNNHNYDSCKSNHPHRFVDGYHEDWHNWFVQLKTQEGCIYDNNVCRLCLEKKNKIIEHHISYFPEDIETVCFNCHELIHHNDVFNDVWVRFTKEEYYRFYNLTPKSQE